MQAQWIETYGPEGSPVLSMLIHDSIMVAGTGNGGVSVSNENCSREFVQSDLRAVIVHSISTIGSRLFAATYGRGGFYSTNMGKNWTHIGGDLDFSHISSFAQNSKGIFVATWGNGILRSKDDGISWQPVLTGLDTNYLYCLTVKNNYLFAGTVIGAFRSSDYGNSWTKVFNGLPEDPNHNLTKQARSIVCNDFGVFIGTENGVFFSNDDGINWKHVNTGLTYPYIFCLAVLGNNILAGTRSGYNSVGGGVFLTKNNGELWEPIGPENLDISSLASNENYLFAGSSTIYMLPLTSQLLDVPDDNRIIPDNFFLSQNYSNPFNPVTTIKYQIPASGNVTLKIFDILGREIVILVNEFQPAGSYSVTFNVETLHGASLPSGIYFYRLQAGGFAETKKMILMK
jgi:hypothetical protein